MKKIVLSLAGVLAATAFAPEAAAIPAYARQVGMACSACHAQHFPVLNSFGRAFKAGGYTMMGSQGKIEGDHMSLPDTLNASMIIKLRYQDDNTAGRANTRTQSANLGEGQFQFFDEFALLFGGRIADNVGFFVEGQLIEPTVPLAAIVRMPFVWDMGGAKLSVIPFAADGGSVMVGYELGSGGVLRANRWSESRSETSAVQYTRNVESASGFAFVAQNDMGYVNFTKWAADYGFKNVGTASALDSNYVRIAATPTVGNWAMHLGAGRMSGSSFSSTQGNAATLACATTNITSCVPVAAVAGGEVVTDLTFFDFQAQGEVGGKELSVYFQHSKAPMTTVVGAVNAYNANNAADRKATTIGVDYSVIPHSLHIGAAYRNATNGKLASATPGAGNEDDAWTVQAIYDMYQNVALHAVYSSFSGSARNGATSQKNLTTLMLEMAW